MRTEATEIDLRRELGSALNELPLSVKVELSNLNPECVRSFVEMYKKRRKKVWVAYLLLFLGGLHYLYLGSISRWLLFALTAGGLFIWLIYDLFTLPSRIKDVNQEKALEILSELKALETCRVRSE